MLITTQTKPGKLGSHGIKNQILIKKENNGQALNKTFFRDITAFVSVASLCYFSFVVSATKPMKSFDSNCTNNA